MEELECENHRSVRISHLVNMLNHENENIRFVARNFLQLDMKKRGVNRTTDDDNFLGFACENTGKPTLKVGSVSSLTGPNSVI